ncbi:hypothetical protein JKP88DRAFT_149478, partial [Tribonema minus]
CNTAAKHGQLGALQLLRSRQPPAPWGTGTVKLACEKGHRDTAMWLFNHNCPLRCPMWTDTCAAAARHGHLAALQYLHTERIAMDELTPAAAARGGHADVLQWTFDVQCAVDESACEEAARGGQVSALRYLKSMEV